MKRKHKNTNRLIAKERAEQVYETWKRRGGTSRFGLIRLIEKALQAHAKRALARHSTGRKTGLHVTLLKRL